MIETNDADRIGTAPTRAAAVTSARLAPGFCRGVFIGWSRPSVHTTLLASTAGGRPAGSAYSSHTRTSSWAAVRRRHGVVVEQPDQVGRVGQRLLDPDREPTRSPGVLLEAHDVQAGLPGEVLGGPVVGGVVDHDDRRAAACVCARSAASDSTSSSRLFQVTTTATTRVGSAVVSGTSEPYRRT